MSATGFLAFVEKIAGEASDMRKRVKLTSHLVDGLGELLHLQFVWNAPG